MFKCRVCGNRLHWERELLGFVYVEFKRRMSNRLVCGMLCNVCAIKLKNSIERIKVKV